MKNVLVAGSSNRDLILTVREFPRPGETIVSNSFLQEMGGKGANQAVAAQRSGATVTFISCIGADNNGESIKDTYQSEGIDVSSVIISKNKPTGVALIMVDQNGENNIVIVPGANDDLIPQKVPNLEDHIEKADFILLQLEIPILSIIDICKKAKNGKRKIMLNAAPAKKIPDELLKLIDVLIVNEIEAEVISGVNVDKHAKEAVQTLLNSGPDQVILTLGEKGLMYGGISSEITHLPAFKVKMVDSTAAGDTFCGALAAALSNEMEWEAALQFSMAAAALSVTKMGAQPSIPKESSIHEFIEKYNLITNKA